MHHTRLKAAVTRYAGEEMKATQLLEAIKADEKGYSTEEIDEIFEAIMLEKNPKGAAASVEKDPVKELPGLAAPYVVCDIWHGSWVATDWMTNPLTGQRAAIAFDFLKSGKVKREKVKVEQRRMEALNNSAHLNVPGIIIEQFLPIDHEGEWSYKRKIVDGIPQ